MKAKAMKKTLSCILALTLTASMMAENLTAFAASGSAGQAQSVDAPDAPEEDEVADPAVTTDPITYSELKALLTSESTPVRVEKVEIKKNSGVSTPIYSDTAIADLSSKLVDYFVFVTYKEIDATATAANATNNKNGLVYKSTESSYAKVPLTEFNILADDDYTKPQTTGTIRFLYDGDNDSDIDDEVKKLSALTYAGGKSELTASVFIDALKWTNVGGQFKSEKAVADTPLNVEDDGTNGKADSVPLVTSAITITEVAPATAKITPSTVYTGANILGTIYSGTFELITNSGKSIETIGGAELVVPTGTVNINGTVLNTNFGLVTGGDYEITAVKRDGVPATAFGDKAGKESIIFTVKHNTKTYDVVAEVEVVEDEVESITKLSAGTRYKKKYSVGEDFDLDREVLVVKYKSGNISYLVQVATYDTSSKKLKNFAWYNVPASAANKTTIDAYLAARATYDTSADADLDTNGGALNTAANTLTGGLTPLEEAASADKVLADGSNIYVDFDKDTATIEIDDDGEEVVDAAKAVSAKIVYMGVESSAFGDIQIAPGLIKAVDFTINAGKDDANIKAGRVVDKSGLKLYFTQSATEPIKFTEGDVTYQFIYENDAKSKEYDLAKNIGLFSIETTRESTATTEITLKPADSAKDKFKAGYSIEPIPVIIESQISKSLTMEIAKDKNEKPLPITTNYAEGDALDKATTDNIKVTLKNTTNNVAIVEKTLTEIIELAKTPSNGWTYKFVTTTAEATAAATTFAKIIGPGADYTYNTSSSEAPAVGDIIVMYSDPNGDFLGAKLTKDVTKIEVSADFIKSIAIAERPTKTFYINNLKNVTANASDVVDLNQKPTKAVTADGLVLTVTTQKGYTETVTLEYDAGLKVKETVVKDKDGKTVNKENDKAQFDLSKLGIAEPAIFVEGTNTYTLSYDTGKLDLGTYDVTAKYLALTGIAEIGKDETKIAAKDSLTGAEVTIGASSALTKEFPQQTANLTKTDFAGGVSGIGAVVATWNNGKKSLVFLYNNNAVEATEVKGSEVNGNLKTTITYTVEDNNKVKTAKSVDVTIAVKATEIDSIAPNDAAHNIPVFYMGDETFALKNFVADADQAETTVKAYADNADKHYYLDVTYTDAGLNGTKKYDLTKAEDFALFEVDADAFKTTTATVGNTGKVTLKLKSDSNITVDIPVVVFAVSTKVELSAALPKTTYQPGEALAFGDVNVVVTTAGEKGTTKTYKLSDVIAGSESTKNLFTVTYPADAKYTAATDKLTKAPIVADTYTYTIKENASTKTVEFTLNVAADYATKVESKVVAANVKENFAGQMINLSGYSADISTASAYATSPLNVALSQMEVRKWDATKSAPSTAADKQLKAADAKFTGVISENSFITITYVDDTNKDKPVVKDAIASNGTIVAGAAGKEITINIYSYDQKAATPITFTATEFKPVSYTFGDGKTVVDSANTVLTKFEAAKNIIEGSDDTNDMAKLIPTDGEILVTMSDKSTLVVHWDHTNKEWQIGATKAAAESAAAEPGISAELSSKAAGEQKIVITYTYATDKTFEVEVPITLVAETVKNITVTKTDKDTPVGATTWTYGIGDKITEMYDDDVNGDALFVNLEYVSGKEENLDLSNETDFQKFASYVNKGIINVDGWNTDTATATATSRKVTLTVNKGKDTEKSADFSIEVELGAVTIKEATTIDGTRYGMSKVKGTYESGNSTAIDLTGGAIEIEIAGSQVKGFKTTLAKALTTDGFVFSLIRTENGVADIEAFHQVGSTTYDVLIPDLTKATEAQIKAALTIVAGHTGANADKYYIAVDYNTAKVETKDPVSATPDAKHTPYVIKELTLSESKDLITELEIGIATGKKTSDFTFPVGSEITTNTTLADAVITNTTKGETTNVKGLITIKQVNALGNKTDVATGAYSNYTLDFSKVNWSKAGTYPVTVKETDSGATGTFDIIIEAKDIKSVAIKTEGPTNFAVGQAFEDNEEYEGLVVTINYTDGTKEDITVKDQLDLGADKSIVSVTKIDTTKADQRQAVTVTVTGADGKTYTATYYVVVVAPTITGMKFTTLPTAKSFLASDVPDATTLKGAVIEASGKANNADVSGIKVDLSKITAEFEPTGTGKAKIKVTKYDGVEINDGSSGSVYIKDADDNDATFIFETNTPKTITIGDDVKKLYWLQPANTALVTATGDELKDEKFSTAGNITVSYSSVTAEDATVAISKTTQIIDTGANPITDKQALHDGTAADATTESAAITTAGKHKVTVTYTEGSAAPITGTYNLETKVDKVKSIAISGKLQKDTYLKGESFNGTGATVTFTMESGRKVTPVALTNAALFEVSAIDQTKIGEAQDLTVTYFEGSVTSKKAVATTTISVTVTENAVKEIAVKGLPKNKNIYTTTDTKLDFSSVKLHVTWAAALESGSKEEDIDLQTAYENGDVTVTGFDLTKAGTQDIKIAYKGVEITYTITVYEMEATGIAESTTSPITKKVKKGTTEAEFRKTGAVTVTFNYDDTNTKEVELSSDKITITGFKSDATGEVEISIFYIDGNVKSDALKVKLTVTDATVKSITPANTALKFMTGDNIDITTEKVTITYDDADTEPVETTLAEAKKVTYTITDADNKAVAKLDKTTKAGVYTVTIKSTEDETYAGATITVTIEDIKVKAITPANNTLVFKQGTAIDISTEKLTISYDNEDLADVETTLANTDKISYTITDANNATVAKFDKTTKAGVYTITVKSLEDETYAGATIKVTVANLRVKTITPANTTLSFNVGSDIDISTEKVTIAYEADDIEDLETTLADSKKVTYTITDADGAAVAKLDKDTKAGVYTVTIKSVEDESHAGATITVTVENFKVKSITPANTALTFKTGANIDITTEKVTIAYDKDDLKDVETTLADSKKVTYTITDADGAAVAKLDKDTKAGVYTVTVKSAEDETYAGATITVTVADLKVKSITPANPTVTLKKDAEYVLANEKVTIVYDGTAFKDVETTLADTDKVTYTIADADGKTVTAIDVKTEGTYTVTVKSAEDTSFEGATITVVVSDKKATDITVTPATATIEQGKTLDLSQFTAKITYDSGDPAEFTLDKAAAYGVTVTNPITATSAAGEYDVVVAVAGLDKTATIKVTVKAPKTVTEFKLSKTSITLNVGDKLDLSDITATITYSEGDPATVALTEASKVTVDTSAVKIDTAGSYTITVTSVEDATKSATITVTVKESGKIDVDEDDPTPVVPVSESAVVAFEKSGEEWVEKAGFNSLTAAFDKTAYGAKTATGDYMFVITGKVSEAKALKFPANANSITIVGDESAELNLGKATTINVKKADITLNVKVTGAGLNVTVGAGKTLTVGSHVGTLGKVAGNKNGSRFVATGDVTVGNIQTFAEVDVNGDSVLTINTKGKMNNIAKLKAQVRFIDNTSTAANITADQVIFHLVQAAGAKQPFAKVTLADIMSGEDSFVEVCIEDSELKEAVLDEKTPAVLWTTGRADLTKDGKISIVNIDDENNELSAVSYNKNKEIRAEYTGLLDVEAGEATESFSSFEKAFEYLADKSGAATITLNGPATLAKAALPKGLSSLTIKGDGTAALTVNATAIKATYDLAFINVPIIAKAASATALPINLAISTTGSKLTIEDVMFDAKSVKLGGNKKATELVIGGVNGVVDNIENFAKVTVSGAIAANKKLTVGTIAFDGGQLSLGNGAAAKIENIEGTGYLGLTKAETAKKFKAITLTAMSADAKVTLVQVDTFTDDNGYKSLVIAKEATFEAGTVIFADKSKGTIKYGGDDAQFDASGLAEGAELELNNKKVTLVIK